MTLLNFLRQLRKDGGDISKLKVRIKGADSGWGEGFKVNGLRGNRMSIEYGGNYDLTSGHSCLSCIVDTISKLPLNRKKKLTEKSEAQAAILVTVVRPKSA